MKSKTVPPEAYIIGQNLKKIREQRGLKQKELAACMDVTFQQVQKYESGRNRIPVEKLFCARHKLEVPYERFFEGMHEGQSARPLYIHQDIKTALDGIQDKRILISIMSLINIFGTNNIKNRH